MGRENWRYKQLDRERETAKKVPAQWTGIGCLVIMLIGVVAYMISGWFLEANALNHWIYIPPVLISAPFIPFLQPGVFLRLVLGVLAALMSYGVLSAIYSIMFPPQLGERDVPPLRPKRRRRDS